MTEDTAHKRSTRDRLVDLGLDRFTVGRSDDDRAYLVENAGPNVALLSAAAKRRLAAVARGDLGITPGRAPLDEAWTTLEGIAAEADKTALPLRVAEHDGNPVLDLGAADGRAVIVTAAGWRVVDRSPVTFRRSKAGLPLPEPARGGTLAPLWDVVNVPPRLRPIVRAWLAAALLRFIPHPVVQIRGEQGAAKTTATHYLGAMLDPCAVGTLSPPQGAERWASAAVARWVIPVDNVSRIEPWWSDELCRTVTGAGSLARALYTDDDIVARPLRGAVILNGISLTSALRSDLAERLLPFDLVRPTAYRTEAQVAEHFAEHHGAMLGAVLDDAAAILANREHVTVPRDLRMADFALVLAAFDAATGLDALGIYRDMHAEASAEALDSDAVARAVLEVLDPGAVWEGPAADLHKRLTAARDQLVAAHELDAAGWWPPDGTRLSSALARSGPLLAAHGVTYTRGRTKRTRTLTLTRSPDPGDADDAGGDADGTPNPPRNDAGDAGDASALYVAPWGGKGERGEERNNRRGSVTSVTSVTPPPDVSGPLGLLRTCQSCGLQAVTSPCSTCRAVAS